MKRQDKIALVIFMIGVLAVFFVGKACAKEIPSNLWQGLIGEAVSEGYNGMYAVACVYRNRLERGLPLGCVALKRKDLNRFVFKQGKKYTEYAKRIIEEVFYTYGKDITKGATHYENIEAFGVPWWTKGMKVTCKIGKHTFYREKHY